jgi:alpha-L-fucosidase 2
MHELRFDTPVQVWDEALPLGNGIMGALVWGDGRPLKISLDRYDLWDSRPVPEFHAPEYKFRIMREWHEAGRHNDLIRMYEEPYNRPAPTKIPAGRIELSLDTSFAFQRTRLSLIEASAEALFSSNARVTAMVHAIEPVGMILARGFPALEPRLAPPPFAASSAPVAENSKTDLRLLGYAAPREESGPGFRAFTQTGVEGFSFAVYLGWKQAQSGWQAAWSIATSNESKDPRGLAEERVRKALATGFAAMASTHAKWWKRYWDQSSVQLPNAVLERQWYLEQYKFGSASRRGYPPINLQGLWTADNGEIPPWKGDYHHDLNTQLSYWPAYSANHLEEQLSYLDWLWQTRDNCLEWTRRFFELPGLCVPMTSDLNNNQLGGWRQYTHSSTTAAWLAHHFYLHWRYSGDRTFLRERAYPYLKDASIFLEAFTSARGPDGLRTFPMTASPEYYDNRPEAWFKTPTNYDVALTRWLFAATSELADELSLTDEGKHWRAVLAELPALSLGPQGELLLARDHPLPESHRHFSHLMAIHPLGMIDWADGEPARSTIRASLADLDRIGTSLWCGYSFAWLGNLASRARDGERAEKALEIFATAFTLKNSFHCNGDQSGKGYSKFVYRPFTLEGNFAEAAGIQEMLLQSQRGKIVVFPAVPAAWKDVSFTTLRAEGAFLVSASRRAGKTEKVNIFAEKGGRCLLISPFGGEDISVETKPGQRLVFESSPQSLVPRGR